MKNTSFLSLLLPISKKFNAPVPVRPGDINVFDCYINNNVKNFMAASLLTFGYRMFKTSVVIKKLQELTVFYNSDDYKNFEKAKDFLAEFLFERLIDTIRIGICFENYFKAKIILNGFSIHLIEKKINPDLFKFQKSRPIGITELIPEINSTQAPILDSLLKKQTITYSTLLENKEYFKYFGMPQNLINFLIELNKSRNKLHMHYYESMNLVSKY